MKYSIPSYLLIFLISTAQGIYCVDVPSHGSLAQQEEAAACEATTRIVSRDEINLRIKPQKNILYHFTRNSPGIGLSFIIIDSNLTRSEYQKYHENPEGFKRDKLKELAPEYYAAQETIKKSNGALQELEKEKPSRYALLKYYFWSLRHKKLNDFHKNISSKYNLEKEYLNLSHKTAESKYSRLETRLKDPRVMPFEEFARQHPNKSALWQTQLPKNSAEHLVHIGTSTSEDFALLRICNAITPQQKEGSPINDSGFVITADSNIATSELAELLGKTEEQMLQDPVIQKILYKQGLEFLKTAWTCGI